MPSRSRIPLLAAALLAAAAPLGATPAGAHARPEAVRPPQRPRTLKLQPLLDRLGLKAVSAAPAELKAGERVRVTVVNPQKLAAAGMRGARVGDVATVEARLPAAQAADRAAAARQGEQAREAAEAAQQAAGSLDAAVSVETTDASGKKKTVSGTVSGAPGQGLPTTAD